MELDHVLIAVTDLEAGAHEFERRGLSSVEGGRHRDGALGRGGRDRRGGHRGVRAARPPPAGRVAAPRGSGEPNFG